MVLGFNPAPGGKERTLSAVIIENVKVSDLPETWRAKLSTPASERVTVRIEEEAAAARLVAIDGSAVNAGWPTDFFTYIAGGWSGAALERAPQSASPRSAQ